MDRLNELLGYKAKYENELIFAKAKVAVVDEMIADEKAKVVEDISEKDFDVANSEEPVVDSEL